MSKSLLLSILSFSILNFFHSKIKITLLRFSFTRLLLLWRIIFYINRRKIWLTFIFFYIRFSNFGFNIAYLIFFNVMKFLFLSFYIILHKYIWCMNFWGFSLWKSGGFKFYKFNASHFLTFWFTLRFFWIPINWGSFWLLNSSRTFSNRVDNLCFKFS